MKSTFFVIINLLFLHYCFAQDVLEYKNNEQITVKVLEIGIKDIQFKLLDSVSSKIYTVSKADVRYIKYANGIVDTIVYNPPAPEKIATVENNNVVPDNKIYLIRRRTELYYDGHRLKDEEAIMLINKYPDAPTRVKMLAEFKLRKSYKQNERLARILWPVLGFGLPVIITSYALFTPTTVTQLENTFLTSVVLGVVIRVGGNVIAIKNKNKRTKSTENIVELYNK
jgi:hypothetical protein